MGEPFVSFGREVEDIRKFGGISIANKIKGEVNR